jgi:hypothetical protein
LVFPVEDLRQQDRAGFTQAILALLAGLLGNKGMALIIFPLTGFLLQ